MERAVVVTGVSSGIGRATASRLIAAGYRVYGSVRRAEDGDRLGADWGERFTPLRFDVTDGESVGAAARLVQDAVGEMGVSGLVNNAGIAVAGPLLHLSPDVLRHQLEVNTVSVLGVTQAFFPLVRAGKGRIVNISSVAGRSANPFLGAYAASKHALEALSDSLRRELLLYGVDVIVIQPGPVQSDIWGKGRAMADAYRSTDYAAAIRRYEAIAAGVERGALPADRVAQLVQRALEHPRPRTRYTPIRAPLLSFWLPRLLPPRFVDRIVRSRVGLYPETAGAPTESAPP